MSRHLERLLEVDKLIRTTRRPTTVSLAEVLEVSQCTIRSDLAFLRDKPGGHSRRHRYHAPLEYSRKLGHHYTEDEWRKARDLALLAVATYQGKGQDGIPDETDTDGVNITQEAKSKTEEYVEVL